MATSGAIALRYAVRDVRAGTHDAVLACGVEKMTAGGSDMATDALAAAFDRPIEQRADVTAPSQYALLARRYLHETDATETDLAIERQPERGTVVSYMEVLPPPPQFTHEQG